MSYVLEKNTWLPAEMTNLRRERVLNEQIDAWSLHNNEASFSGRVLNSFALRVPVFSLLVMLTSLIVKSKP